MKTKKLLSCAIAFAFVSTAFSATDITPQGLKFNTAAPITGADFFLKAPGGSNPTANDPNMKGLMDAGDRSFFWGMGDPGAKNTTDQVAAGFSIVDYGDGVGKVLRFDGQQYQGGAGWAAFAVYGDYRTLPHLVTTTDKAKATVRVRVVFNCDFPHEWVNTNLTNVLLEFSIKSASGTVLGTSAARKFMVADFKDSDFDPETEEETNFYAPNWYSAEWDIRLASADGSPCGIFFAVPGTLKNVIYNIKEISFTTDLEDPKVGDTDVNIPAVYTMVDKPSSIQSIAAEQLTVTAEDGKVQVYGVAAGEMIRITSLAGSTQSVVSTGEITTIELSKGSYVIAAGEKVSKVIF